MPQRRIATARAGVPVEGAEPAASGGAAALARSTVLAGILLPSVLNGLTTGAVYALVALGLTLIYGVLHIINFAHGAALMVALYAVYFLQAAARASIPTWRCRSWCRRCSRSATALQRWRDRPRQPRQGREHPAGDAGPGDRAREPGAAVLQVATRAPSTPPTRSPPCDLGPAMIALPKVVAFAGALVAAALLLCDR